MPSDPNLTERAIPAAVHHKRMCKICGRETTGAVFCVQIRGVFNVDLDFCETCIGKIRENLWIRKDCFHKAIIMPERPAIVGPYS